MEKTLLLVEDDLGLAEVVSEFLRSNGFRVHVESTGDGVLERVDELQPSAVILDVLLPGKNGLAICKEVRARHDVPIIMLTALGDDVDQIVGLEVGADDYLAKPVSPRLLLARVRALIRRAAVRGDNEGAGVSPARVVNAGPIRLDYGKREVRVLDVRVPVTDAEFELLALLAARVGEVVSRDELYAELRGTEYDGIDRSIDIRISRLRNKLGPGASDLVKSVRGQGYMLGSA